MEQEFDLESEIEDIEGLMDFLGDIGLTLKGHFKARLKSIRRYNILLKRNQNRTREVITRYKLDKVTSIPVGNTLKEFFVDEIPLAANIDIIDKVLNISIEDFNLDIINVLISNNRPKLIAELAKSNNELDVAGTNLILSEVVHSDDLVKRIKDKEVGFITSYLYGNSLKGIVVDTHNNILYHKRFSYNAVPVTANLIPISLLNSTIESFINHNDTSTKSALRIYKRVIKDIGRLLRTANDDDSMDVSNIRLITDAVMYHVDNMVDSLFKHTSVQYSFIRAACSELDGTTAFTGRTSL